MSLKEFLAGPYTYALPGPGGSIIGGAEKTHVDADLYLAEVAATIKAKEYSPSQAVELIHRRIDQIKVQKHFGKDHDVMLIDRLNAWTRELSN